MAKKPLLSLDVGGARVLILDSVSIDLFGANASGHILLKSFDLVVGSSGSYMVTAKLIKNYALVEIINFFGCSHQKIYFSQLLWYQKNCIPRAGRCLHRNFRLIKNCSVVKVLI